MGMDLWRCSLMQGIRGFSSIEIIAIYKPYTLLVHFFLYLQNVFLPDRTQLFMSVQSKSVQHYSFHCKIIQNMWFILKVQSVELSVI